MSVPWSKELNDRFVCGAESEVEGEIGGQAVLTVVVFLMCRCMYCDVGLSECVSCEG